MIVRGERGVDRFYGRGILVVVVCCYVFFMYLLIVGFLLYWQSKQIPDLYGGLFYFCWLWYDFIADNDCLYKQ